jgi:hypothetical protein
MRILRTIEQPVFAIFSVLLEEGIQVENIQTGLLEMVEVLGMHSVALQFR